MESGGSVDSCIPFVTPISLAFRKEGDFQETKGCLLGQLCKMFCLDDSKGISRTKVVSRQGNRRKVVQSCQNSRQATICHAATSSQKGRELCQNQRFFFLFF